MIRQAKIDDSVFAARLYYLAGPSIFKFFFAVDEKKAIKLVEQLFYTQDTIFSKDFFHVADENNETKGAIVTFPGKDKKKLEKNIEKYSFTLIKNAGFVAFLKMILRSRIEKTLPEINDDELYIQAIAVNPEYRGRRIASRLLQHALNTAQKKGIPKVSLLVETPNEHAIQIYQKYGFQIKATKKFEQNLRKHNLFGVHKMVVEF